MKASSSQLTFSISDQIKEIPLQDWDELFGNELIESYGYLKTLEEGCEGFSFRYLVAKRDTKTVFILPLFIADFSLTTLVPEFLYKFAGKFSRWTKMKVLFVGSPTTEEFSMGISSNEKLDDLLGQALKELNEFSKKEKIIGITFFNLSPKHAKIAELLKQNKFLKLEALPTTVIHLKDASLQDYIQGLGKNTRKDLKKKLRHAEELAHLRTELYEDVSDAIIDEVYKLFMNNFNAADVHFERLTREFFLNICKNMPGVAKYFITYDNDKIVAFNLCLIKNKTFIDKFVGFDSDVAHKYHLYYTTLCHNIEWCIKNNLKSYQPGFTDYHPKVRMGAKLIPLDMYTKALNPLLQAILVLIRPLIEPKNMDSSLKKIEKSKDIFTEGIS